MNNFFLILPQETAVKAQGGGLLMNAFPMRPP